MGAELTRPGGAGTLVLAGNVSRPPRGTRLGRLKTLGIQHRPVVRHCPGKRVRSVAAPRPPASRVKDDSRGVSDVPPDERESSIPRGRLLPYRKCTSN